MSGIYGARTKDASGVVTLDTSITPIRSLKMMTVTGDGSYNQYFSIPEIKASSFIVVDALYKAAALDGTWSPQAFWTDGQLHLRAPGTRTWQVMILANGEPFAAPGTYGIRASNNGNKVQIDPINRVLSVKYGGQFEFGVYKPPGGSEQYSPNFYYQFPEPITSYERPLIFLNAANYMMVSAFYVEGTPGNWVGWGIAHVGAAYRYHGMTESTYMQMRWFAATYQPPREAVGEYGIRVNDATGSRIFSSSTNLVSLANQPANNSFYNDNEPIGGGGSYTASARMAWTGSFEDYVLANALFSSTNIEQTTNPIKTNWGGFLPGNRSILKMYTSNFGGSLLNPIGANGRTLFAARPMRPL